MYVVVDGFGDPHHTDFQAPLGNGLRYFGGGHERAVATDHEQNADMVHLQAIDHPIDLLGTARGAQNRPPHVHDGGHPIRFQIQKFVVVFGDEPFQSVADTVDVLDPVAVVQLQHNGPDDIVQTRAQATAGRDGTTQLGGIEIDLAPRTGQFEGRREQSVGDHLFNVRSLYIDHHPVLVGNEELMDPAEFFIKHG